jgi:hypothetical protein
MAGHAILSPSSAKQWSNCFAAPAMQAGIANRSSIDADEGTAMHDVAEQALRTGRTLESYVGQVFNGFELTSDSANTLYKGYIAPVRTLAERGQLFVEQRMGISHITGEKGAEGTSDTVILNGDEIIIADLKWGIGVRVEAFQNDQLIMYALAALEQFCLLGDFKSAKLLIFQPRLDHVDEWSISVEKLIQEGERLKTAAKRATVWLMKGINDIPLSEFAPAKDVCRWCKVKGECQPLAHYNFGLILDEFIDLDVDKNVSEKLANAIQNVHLNSNAVLGSLLSAVPLIRDWCNAVVARAESEVHAGREVPGFKLVQGKAGNRKWIDSVEAEKVLKSMRLKTEQMYDYKLISPTSAEAVLKTAKPKAWVRLQSYITKAPGSSTVVPVSDKRPAIVSVVVEDEFSNLD